MHRVSSRLLFVVIAILAGTQQANAHRMEGELVVQVYDPTGLPVPARIELENRVAKFRTSAQCGAGGRAHLRRLPLGVHRILITHGGFQTLSERLEFPSEVPVTRRYTLDVAAIETTLTIQDSAPLLDPNQTGSLLQIGREQLAETAFTTLGRGAIGNVTSLPGWLLEANAVLHPRGSEYDTQYVIDGVPIYDNRSIGFVPAFETDEFEAVNVMTANIPAEFGRRLGGVIELYTRRPSRQGHHPEIVAQGGSFGSAEGSFLDQYSNGPTSFTLGLRAGTTDRYLDPPSLDNFTNWGSSAGVNFRADHDLSDADRLTFALRSSRVNFLVPNTIVQQEAGQRQDRQGAETAGQAQYQHVFSPRSLGVARGMIRDTTAQLWSNPLSTPVIAAQDRGFREGTASGSYRYDGERHAVKFGGDYRTAAIRESFRFALAADSAATLFDFQNQDRSHEAGVFVQDHFSIGRLVVDAGVRFDSYRLLVHDTAVSPRVGAAYYWEAADVLFRGSYDRAFQPPAIENLLLSNSAETLLLDEVEDLIPVQPSRANFYEVGIRKVFGQAFRLDVNQFWRDFENFADDDVFLNTGLGFPITFESAAIRGTEARLEMPRFGKLTSFLSYSNLLGTATSPVTGGLFIEGGEADEFRDVARTFAITQDQRNTVSGVARYEFHPRFWTAATARFGSGLPFEAEGDGHAEEEAAGPAEDGANEETAIPSEILKRINFDRGRVRPNFSVNFSLGAVVWQRDGKSARLQFDLVNATDRLNVINFSGVFSGTALAPGRMAGLKLHVVF